MPTSYLGMSGSNEGGETLAGGGALSFGLAGGSVVAPDGGTECRVGGGMVWRVVAPVGGTEGRVGAGGWGGGVATLCDRSRMAALIGSSVP